MIYFDQIMKIEDLQGIIGSFSGEIRHHSPRRNRRSLAVGQLTYPRTVGKETIVVTIPVKGVLVRRLSGSDDLRRYVRVTRGSGENKDKIIGLIDRE